MVADATQDRTAILDAPTVERTDFDAGARFTCTDENDQWYAFAGYEEEGDAG